MNTMTVTRKSSDAGLSADIRRDAERGPVLTPDYVVLRRDALTDFTAYEGLLETLRIMSNSGNAEDLRGAIREADAGMLEEHELIEE
jgi:hypothetical protein